MDIGSLHIVVVGAGTGGAASALLLARAGARVTIVERVAEPRAVGAGIALAANGLAVLECLGLGDALAAVGCTVRTPRIVDARGRLLYDLPEPTPRVLMLRRSDLHGLLMDALAREPRVEQRFGVEVVGARSDGTVQLDDARRLAGDLVVGADGVHSRIRAAGDFGARVAAPGIAYLRALVRGERATGVEAWTAAGIFGSFEVPGGAYVYASAGSPATRRAVAARDLDALRRVWAAAYPKAAPLLGAVARFDDLIVNRVIRVECARWFDGRTVLLGDAAHAMAPNLGQGANSALVDAAILLDALRAHASIASALAAYEARRAPAVRWVARAAHRLGAIAEFAHPAARAVRDRLLLPLALRLARDPTPRVLQEASATLVAMGRTAEGIAAGR
jgi:2-polyprenyl-6-methoxyphenol hydroxylase-like FAD-dependent oxidoreductase